MTNVNSEDKITEYFDLTVYLRQNVIDLRGIADEYGQSTESYFKLLSDFISLAPDVNIALATFSGRAANIEACKCIDKMAALLGELKFDRFITEFYTILGSYDHGNWKLAAYQAKSVTEQFDEFKQKISSARKPKKPDNAPDAALSLKEYIMRLDEIEADRKMVILAVDDSPSILTSISYVLGKEYKVFTLLKSTELEKVLQKLTPDLILLDYEMPGLNGFELVPIIRGFKEHADTPVIYLTSIGTIDTVTSAMAIGACDFIVKPFNPDILLEKIGRHIVRKKTF